MTEHDNDKERPKTAAEAEGSIVERARHPVRASGEPTDKDVVSRSEEGRPDQLSVGGGTSGSGEAARERRRPVRRMREPDYTPSGRRGIEATITRPSDEEGTHTEPLSLAVEEPRAEEVDPAAERRAEGLVTALFLLSAVGTLMFVVYFWFNGRHDPSGVRQQNVILGLGLTLALSGIGAGMVVWAKKLIPHPKGVQEREELFTPEEDQLQTEELFFKGVDQLGIGRRKMMRRSLTAALGLFPLVFLWPLRELGPLPRRSFRHTTWRKDVRLVDADTRAPVKLGDLEIGSIKTVMPEGFVSVNEEPLSPTMLIRLEPGLNVPRKGRENWAPYDHVAYSKICTHAGCPIGLYEHQTHHLLCPCHQSTFDVPHACKVIFGPAARPLPQLPLYIDPEGYLRAQSDYHEPTGPSFWERGGVPR